MAVATPASAPVFSTWPLDDVRSLVATCTNPKVWRYYDHYPQIPREENSPYSLDSWLNNVHGVLMEDPACRWVEIKLDYGRLHEETVVYTPTVREEERQKGIWEGWEEEVDGVLEEEEPAGSMISWDELVQALHNPMWPSSGSKAQHAPPKLVEVEWKLPIDRTIPVSYIHAHCANRMLPFLREDHCDKKAPEDLMQDVDTWLLKVRSFLTRGPCEILDVAFFRSFNLQIGESLRVKIAQADLSAPAWPGAIVDWSDLKAGMRELTWSTCDPDDPVKPIPGWPADPPTRPIPGDSPWNGPIPPHFTWAPTNMGYLTWEKPRSTYAIASCPGGMKYRLQPSDWTYPPSEEHTIRSVNEWLSVVVPCIGQASKQQKVWVTVTFFSEESQDGHSELVRQSDYFIVTQYWESLGNQRPLPPGQRIRMGDFVDAMTRMKWRGTTRKEIPNWFAPGPVMPPIPAGAPVPAATLEPPTRLNHLQQSTTPQDLEDAPWKGPIPPHFTWAPTGPTAYHRTLPWHAYMIAYCPSADLRLEPTYRASPNSHQQVFLSMEEWLGVVAPCVEEASALKKNWVTIQIWAEEGIDGHTELVRQGCYLVVTDYWDSQGANKPLPPGQRIRLKDFMAEMRAQRWQKNPWSNQPIPAPLTQPKLHHSLPIPAHRPQLIQEGWISASDPMFNVRLPGNSYVEALWPGGRLRLNLRGHVQTHYPSSPLTDPTQFLAMLSAQARESQDLYWFVVKLEGNAPRPDGTSDEVLIEYYVPTERWKDMKFNRPELPPGLRMHWAEFVGAIRGACRQSGASCSTMTSDTASLLDRVSFFVAAWSQSLGLTPHGFGLLSIISALHLIVIYLLVSTEAEEVTFGPCGGSGTG